MREILPDTASVTDGRLVIADIDAAELADRYGTPLIVLDRATIEARADSYSKAVGSDHVFYAGKAFCCVGVFELLAELGLGLDVCTGGELTTAQAAGFPPERILFHGNNKSLAELQHAKDYGVGRIVIDSFDEIERLSLVRPSASLLLRVTPGVEAHTHEFVQTGQEDSKFGFGLGDGVALKGLRSALEHFGEDVVGIHAHIGSQIFEMAAFDLAVKRLAAFLVHARTELGFTARELNLGGGLGIAHTEDEMTPDPVASWDMIRGAVVREFGAAGLEVPELFAEPGRSLIGAAAVSLYRIGTIKEIPGVRTYVSVDGGMSDNIRPALYGARYEAFLAERADAPDGPRVTLSGKHCESGDVLIRDVHLPKDVAVGDLVCIPATGAYTYSMASNYNRVPRPAVVLVHSGDATEIVARETDHDLLRYDRRLDGKPLT